MKRIRVGFPGCVSNGLEKEVGRTDSSIPCHEPDLRQCIFESDVLSRLRISDIGVVVPASFSQYRIAFVEGMTLPTQFSVGSLRSPVLLRHLGPSTRI